MTLMRKAKFVLPFTVAVAFAMSSAGAIAGKGGNGGGNSGGNGGGNSSNKSASEKGSGKAKGIRGEKGSGLHPSELKKVNGVLNANINATRNANENSVHGLARTIAQSQTAVADKEADLQLLKDALTDLSNERTTSVVQSDLDDELAKDVVDADLVKKLEDELALARTDAEVAEDAGIIAGQIGTLEEEVLALEESGDAAIDKLTNGEGLSDAALAALMEKVGQI